MDDWLCMIGNLAPLETIIDCTCSQFKALVTWIQSAFAETVSCGLRLKEQARTAMASHRAYAD
jgi:hypothetical protein